jgi:hypothetical protein
MMKLKNRTENMHLLAIVAALIGFALGLVSAYYWWLASRIETMPVWGDREPVDPILSQGGWIAGMMNAASESARLNQKAAVFTAIAVLLSTGSAVIGLFA